MPARRGMVYAWITAIASLAIADAWLNRRRDGSTLSEVARYLFRTHTPAGRTAFVLSWAALTAWLLPHICRTRKNTPLVSFKET